MSAATFQLLAVITMRAALQSRKVYEKRKEQQA
jgi:hypothetical protein